MSTGVKAHRPNRLTEEETLTSFEDWRNSVIFYLSQETSFALFLQSGTTWNKTSEGVEHRGLVDDTKLQNLRNFLGVIATLAPPLLHGDIIDDTTKLSDIFNLIRTYYQFAPSESTFLKFASIKREVVNGSLERPIHLYLRMRQFIRDNLLLSGGKIQHDGKTPTSDETLSPTTERLIVLRWLELLHPLLPVHVGKVFSHDLRTKSLKDLHPQIVEQVDDLIRQIEDKTNDTEASLMYANFHSKKSQKSQFNSNGGRFNSSRTDNTRYNNKPNFKQVSFNFKQNPTFKKCEACHAVGEPFIGHSIHNCPNIASKDRTTMLRTFALEVDDIQEVSGNNSEDEDTDVKHITVDDRNQVDHAEINRVSIKQSPQVNVKINNSIVTMVVDTGATGSMIRLDLCNSIGLKIYPSPHSAIQADGESKLSVVGEVHTSMLTEDGISMKVSAIVVTKLKAGLIIGTGFLKEHQIVIDIPRNLLILPGNRIVKFNSEPGNPKVSLLRAEVNHVIFPGETLSLPTPISFLHDEDVAIEPREEHKPWYTPFVTDNRTGRLILTNESENAISIKKGQIIGQVRSVVESNIDIESNQISVRSSKLAQKSVDPVIYTEDINIDQDNILSSDEVKAFKDVNEKYCKVFNPKFSMYNGKSGNVIASVNLGKMAPTPKKGKVPSYNRKNLQILQEKFDELVEQGVLIRPEENNVKVTHSSPSFLVKKTDSKAFRLVTSFTELNKFIRPLPSKISTSADVLKSLSRWKYIIKTDLKSAYYQINVDKESQQWLGTNSPYKGMYVYCRGAMGLRNMAEFLEEVISRVLGDCVAEGIVEKVADDLVIGGDTVPELLINWNKVLQRLADNNLTLAAGKTFICPKTIKIIGWIWQGGTIEVDIHRINPLTICPVPDTVKQLRSFIGAFRAVSICIPKYGHFLSSLEDFVAGKESRDILSWTDDLRKCFTDAQKALSKPKSITLPHPKDQLILISDGCNSPPAVGSTLFVKRDDHLRVAGYFSAKIAKYQLLWLPCEIEALCINLSIRNFSDIIRESHHKTKFLTDSKPCVQAFEKLSNGGFSLSPRLSSFLMNLNAHNISVDHVKGSSIILTDFVSRNPVTCPDKNCQVCLFVGDQLDIAVRAISIDDIKTGAAKMPFYNYPAWRDAQMNDPELKRCFSQLSTGTRPGKKEKNLRVLRRYLQIASISEKGLLVYRKPNPFGRDFELIIVPKELATGLISALHLQLGHPPKTQFKKVWDRYFFSLQSEQLIENCTLACPLCTSLQTLPKELFEQNTQMIPAAIGKTFSADVIRREGQKLFIILDTFSSFIMAHIIDNEQGGAIREALVQLTVNFKHPEGCTIRVDNAPGFKSLKDDKYLQSLGITLDFGRVKNKNHTPCIDKAIQDIEKEIKRLLPNGGRISPGTLAIAVCKTNSRVRLNGLSAKEILTKRDNFTNESLHFDDNEISNQKYAKRVQNHPSSEKSKSKGASPASIAKVSTGDIVHIKNEGTKHRAREFYLIVSVDDTNNTAKIRKFCGNTLRGQQYLVRLNEIYLASANYTPFHKSSIDDEEEGVKVHTHKDDDDNDDQNAEELSDDSDRSASESTLRRSTRTHRRPQWLATDEIQRTEYPT